jgi:hypothetical protein
MIPPNTAPQSAELTALLAVVEGKQRGLQRLSATTGPADARHLHVRTQLFLARREHDQLKAMGATLARHVGRPVAQALTVRLALQRLSEETERSVNDPAVATRLATDLLNVRAERADPTPSTPPLTT